MLPTLIVLAVVANVRGYPAMKDYKVRHDIKAAGKIADLILFQEFNLPRYFAAMKSILLHRNGPTRWFGWGYSYGRGGQVVAFRRAVWKRRSKNHQTLLHNALAGVSDERYITFVNLEARKMQGVQVIAGSTHYLPGHHYGRYGNKAERRQRARQGDTNLVNWANRHYDKGRLMIIGLDSNSPQEALREALAPHLKGRARFVSDGVMHIILIDSPTHEWYNTGTLVEGDVYTDHDMLRPRLGIRPKGQ